NTSFGAITNWLWDFGDGQTSSLPSPSHSYQVEGDFEITLRVLSSNGLSSAHSQAVSALAGYQIGAGAYSWIDPTGMTTLSLGNSGVSSALSLPFPFLFFGHVYTAIYVGAD